MRLIFVIFKTSDLFTFEPFFFFLLKVRVGLQYSAYTGIKYPVEKTPIPPPVLKMAEVSIADGCFTPSVLIFLFYEEVDWGLGTSF